ncbi:unnamed protein product [Allacma fusca]|uniref:Xanthine dehydrogenase n=1 Tax=Allacma fusca TaxID=39272 RepID=A0A8J2L8Q1_9HEXA|nr:unnamed protein product [Allacma fusca]
MSTGSDTLIFFVNGKKVLEPNPNPQWSLLRYLRDKLRLYGAKNACNEGGCGACTVMVSYVNSGTGKITNAAVNACLAPLCSLHGTSIVTVEGLGSIKQGLHPIQERIAKSHGSQCGFCTPGFVMSTYALLRNNPTPSEEELESSLYGNLCRCTGYRPILQGLKTFCGAENCCRNKNGETKSDVNGNCFENQTEQSLINPSEFRPYDPTQEPIFPSELQLNAQDYEKALIFRNQFATWCRPHSLKSLLKLKYEYSFAKLVGGNTEIQLKDSPVYIQIPRGIPELDTIQENDTHLVIGSRATFSDLQSFCFLQLKQKNNSILYSAILNMLSTLGDVQTRNAATIGGSIPSGNPASDSNTFFAAAGGVVTLQCFDNNLGSSERFMPLDDDFLKPGGGTYISPYEIIINLRIPLPTSNEFIWSIKQSDRKFVAAANVFFATRICFEGSEVVRAKFTVDGIMTGIIFPKQLEQYFIGKKFSTTEESLSLIENAPKLHNRIAETNFTDSASIKGILYKLSEAIQQWQDKKPQEKKPTFKKASQLFQEVSGTQSPDDLVGRPVVHLPALKQTTGEAIFLNDIPETATEAFGVFVLSEKVHAKILNKNYTAAKALEGVLAIYDSSSLPGAKNRPAGPTHTHDECIFADDTVGFHGQVIALVVATSKDVASAAAKLVRIEYEDKPAVLTLDEAITTKTFLDHLKMTRGDVNNCFAKSDIKVLEGEFRTGGQKHFYMEPNSCIAYPKEDDELEIVFTTQAMTHAQETVSKCLGLPANKVIITTRRLGGGFGGKETRILFLPVAASLAALDLKRPVRCVLTREEDMKIVGGRHEMLCRYSVSFNSEGLISALQANVFSNAGESNDYSTFILGSAMRAIATAYNIEHCDLKGHTLRTNTQSNTAFRGFGAPQGAIMIEHIVEAVAAELGMNPNEIREQHFYKNGEVTPFGHIIENSNTRRCWEECQVNSNYTARLKAVQDFNLKSKFIKKGLALIPLTYLIGFPVPTMNQGGALVMIYRDGSVAINHGGVEMGQGLQTKMMQIASRALGVPVTKIRHRETSTDKVPNTSTSAGSMTTDLNGPAVVEACEILSKRLQPFKEAQPDGTWESWVEAAYLARVNLSTTGFTKLEFTGICNYQVYGTGCTEVEIDCLTGEFKIIRTDIVMDVGQSLNPAIDIGQIEGAFVQGIGWVTMEQVGVTPDGHLTATGPATYKIPGVANIPQEFNVSLLKGSSNPRAVYSSKAIGEPPLLLVSSVFIAIQNAVKEARRDANLDMKFPFDAPATAEKIRNACGSFGRKI